MSPGRDPCERCANARAAGSPARPARRAWRVVALVIVACAVAGALRVHAAAVVWVTPLEHGVAALDANGRVTLTAGPGATPVVLASGVQSDALRACHGRLLAVGDDGRLLDVLSGLRGPAASPHSRPACLEGGGVVVLRADARAVLRLDAELRVLARRELAALPDGDPIPVSGAVAVLADPTERYRHGVLGDEIEAATVVLLDGHDLHPLGQFTVAPPAVVEQRRVLPFPAAGPAGMLITRSTPEGGAAVVAVALVGGALRERAATAPIGAGNRWLNLFVAVGGRAYAVRTPHLGGPLERYAWTGTGFEVTRSPLDVTNHRLGSRNLDLAAMLPQAPGQDGDLLALPSSDLRAVRFVLCRDDGCRVLRSEPLPATLTSNLVADGEGGAEAVVAGLSDGRVIRLDPAGSGPDAAPAPGARRATPHPPKSG